MTHKNRILCMLFLTGALGLSAQSDFKEYGGKLSMGVSILDGFGIPVRYYAGSNVLEGGVYIGGIALYENDELSKVAFEPMIGGSYTYFGNRFLKVKKRRNKIRANGISLRVNQLLGDYPTTIPSLSWAQETFREGRTNRSFIFELGIQYSLPHFTYLGTEPNNQIGIRLRCQWNFFLK